jgi:glycosyltransferase involved in cell wall biosynthesis
MDLAAWPFPERLHVRWLVRLTLQSASFLLTIRSRQYLIEKFGLNKKRVLFLESCPDEKRVSAGLTGSPRFRRTPDEFVMCCSGGHEHHRLERFLPIFEQVIRLVPKAKLLVIADPSKPVALSALKLAESGGLSRNIQLLPVIKPAEDFYATLAQCDLWIATLGDDTLQGNHEFRMELLEVGLLGKAVMAAPTAGLLDNGLSEGQEILYIRPAEVGPSAMKIAAIANDRRKLSLLGKNLESHVKRHFSLAEAVDRLLQLPQLHRSAKEEARAPRPDAVNTTVGQ